MILVLGVILIPDTTIMSAHPTSLLAAAAHWKKFHKYKIMCLSTKSKVLAIALIALNWIGKSVDREDGGRQGLKLKY